VLRQDYSQERPEEIANARYPPWSQTRGPAGWRRARCFRDDRENVKDLAPTEGS